MVAPCSPFVPPPRKHSVHCRGWSAGPSGAAPSCAGPGPRPRPPPLSARPPPLLPFFLGLGAGGQGGVRPVPTHLGCLWGGLERGAGCSPAGASRSGGGGPGRGCRALGAGSEVRGLGRGGSVAPRPGNPRARPAEPRRAGWFPAGAGGAPRWRPQTRRSGARGWRQAASFVYLTAKYQGDHRLAALPPTPTAKTNSWAERMPLLS